MNTTTSLYDLPYRNYDPTLGRFFQVDPMAHVDHNLTPYHYSRNNPLGFNDPSGALEEEGMMDDGAGNGWSNDGGSNEGGGEGGGGDSGITVHSVTDNGNGTSTLVVTGSDGQGYTVIADNNTGAVVYAANNDAADLGNTGASVSGSFFTQNGDGTGTGVSWSTGGGQFTVTSTTGALDSRGTGILAGPNSTLNSSSFDLSSTSSEGGAAQAGFTDEMLGLWSVASYGKGIYDEARSYSIVKNTKAMYDEYKSIRNFNSGYKLARQTELLTTMSKNFKMFDALKVGARDMVGLGTVIGLIDIANAKPEERLNKAAWVAADTAMGIIGLTGLGAPVAAVYFGGRFAYGIYEMATSSH